MNIFSRIINGYFSINKKKIPKETIIEIPIGENAEKELIRNCTDAIVTIKFIGPNKSIILNYRRETIS